MRIRCVCAASACVLAVLAPPPARAQETGPDSALTLAPVMVRVLRSTIGTGGASPLSLAAGAELTRGKAGAFLEEAVRAIPGVQIQNRFNLAVGERLAIRGFGSRAQFGVRGIRVLVDGIPATLPDGQATLDHLDLASLGRVEALRGPAGALYGNAAGGVLHFRTLDPRAEPTSASARFTGGSHGLRTIQLAASGTTGSAGYRLGVTRLDYDGFRTDPVAADGSTYGAAERTVVNGTLVVPAGGGTVRLVLNGVDLDADNPGSLNAATLDLWDRQARDFNVNNRLGKTVTQGQLGATWSGTLGGTEAEFSTWGIRRELENPIPGTIVGVDRNAGGFRTLLTGTSRGTGGAFSWGTGLEVELQRDDRRNWGNNAGDKGALTLDQQERVRGVGLFGQGRVDLDSNVSVLGGVRYDRIRFAATDRFVAPGDPDDSGARTMDAVTPSVGFVYGAAEGVELFGSVASSFETPTTTELANQATGSGGFNPDLDPQRGITLEGGARGRLADAWNVEANVFRTRLTGELVAFQVPSDPGRDYYRNSGRSHHTGLEVAVDGRPTPRVGVRVAYTRVDARFDEFVTDAGDDYSGNRVPGLAPNRLDGLLTLERGPAYVELRGLAQGAMPVDDAGTEEADGYLLVDVDAGLRDYALGSISVSPFVGITNVLDRRYVSSVVVNAFGSRYYEPGPPRSFRLGLGVTWSP